MYERFAYRPPHTRQDWLSQIFHCRAAQTGGVIKRQVFDVEREVGMSVLMREVRRRGFQMIRTKHHVVIVCDPDRIEVLI